MNARILLFASAMAIAVVSCKKNETASPSSTAGEHEAFGRMTVEELEQKMAEAKAGKLTLAIYDNNEKERYEVDHIPGAKWVPHDNVQAKDLPADKEATLVFYCANEH